MDVVHPNAMVVAMTRSWQVFSPYHYKVQFSNYLKTSADRIPSILAASELVILLGCFYLEGSSWSLPLA